MNKILFETPRLRCRRWVPADREPLSAVYSDPETVRYVGDGQPLTLAQCDAWLEVTAANYQKRGYGMFALEERATGAVVGFCGLVHPGGQEEAEIKYALLRSHWGQGLASEFVPKLLHYGATEHHLTTIIATVAPGNKASQRVLLKAGMILVRTEDNDDGSQTQVYSWTPSEAKR